MHNDAAQRLREPGAWVLLGSVGLQLVSALIGLFGDSLPFTFRAYDAVRADRFADLAGVGLVVVAVLLVTRLGGAPTRQARTVVLGGLVLLGTAALFTVIGILAGLAAGSSGSGVLLNAPVSDKLAMFLHGIARLAVVGVGGYWVFTVHQSFGPAQSVSPQYPQQPLPHEQQARQPYPPASYVQPSQRQPYVPPAQPYGQQAQQPYAQPPEQPYAQPPQQPYGQVRPSGYGGGQDYGRTPYGGPQGGHPQPPSYQQPPARPVQPPQPPPQAPPGESEGEGEWTRAYGPGELSPPQEGPQPADGGGQSPSNDPYRPPE